MIQLGAIIAVIIIFWEKMFPFNFKDKTKNVIKRDIIILWFKVVVACIPGAVFTLLFDDYIEKNFHTPIIISLALVFYGIIFIVIENAEIHVKVNSLSKISFKHAFIIGLFQVLSIIPGTSRSGSTIIGGLLIGISRSVIAEFTFFLAVPAMLGFSILKLFKFGLLFTPLEVSILFVGMITAFLVSLAVVKFFMNYIKKNNFKIFGWYRIILGIIVLIYFFIYLP